MRFSRVLRNFLIGYAILHLVVAAVFLFVLTAWLSDQMLDQTRHRMLDLSYSLREHIRNSSSGMDDRKLLQFLQNLESDTGARFTLITDQGRVAVDSRTGFQPIGDHGNRPEIVEARTGGVGFHQRNSATLNLPLLYLAIRLYDEADPDQENGFVRVAVEARSVFETISSLQKFLWLFTLGTGLLAGLLMIIFATREMRPLQTFAEAANNVAAGQYASIPGIARREDEWKLLAEAFSTMQEELRQRETHLRENSMRLQAVLGSMVEGVLSVNAGNCVLVANNAACQMLGVLQDDLVGNSLLDIVRIPELGKAVQHTLLTQSAARAEFETLGRTRRVLQVHVAPLSDQRDFGAAVVMHDVTELRNLETMRRDFAANVSHELKTPLASIKAYAETLRLGALYDQDNNLNFVQQIESQAELLNNQIGDLLKLSELESGHAFFDITEIEVARALNDCRDRFRLEAERRGLQIVVKTGNEAAVVATDSAALRTILDNLVSNAIRYTPVDGEVRLTGHSKGESTQILISDNGIGISDEHKERIFERFYRVDKARSRDLGGTGLGLAIVKHTIGALGGTIEVKSKPGQGSTFTITIPGGR